MSIYSGLKTIIKKIIIPINLPNVQATALKYLVAELKETGNYKEPGEEPLLPVKAGFIV